MRTALILTMTLALAACGDAPSDRNVSIDEESTPVPVQAELVQSAPSSSYDEAHAAASAAIAAATETGFAWSTSDQLIVEAAKAAESGNESLAITLADEARIHAELAMLQAEHEAVAWRERVISTQ